MKPPAQTVRARSAPSDGADRARRQLVIGFGNELRGDDALGPLIVRRLAQHSLRGTKLLECHQLTPELADELEGCSRIIFVDASVRQLEQPVDVRQLQPVAGFSPGHHYTPEMLLDLTVSLHGVVPEAYLVQVRGYCFDFGAGVSDAALLHIEAAASVVLALLGVQETGDA